MLIDQSKPFQLSKPDLIEKKTLEESKVSVDESAISFRFQKLKINSIMKSSNGSYSFEYFSSGCTIDDFPGDPPDLNELVASIFEYNNEIKDSFQKTMKKIEKLEVDGGIFGSRLKKIMTITHFLQVESDDRLLKSMSLDLFNRHLDIYNVYVCLSYANKINAETHVKKCLSCIENVMLVKLELIESILSIEVCDLTVPYIQILTMIQNLFEIYDKKIHVTLSPGPFVEEYLLKQFLVKVGKSIHSLNLNSHTFEISDELLEKVIILCPNLQHLSVKSNSLKGFGLKKINILNQLISLDLSCCPHLIELGNFLSSNLIKLNLSSCNRLMRIDDLPLNLLELDVSFCIELNILPVALPSKLKKLNISWCWNLIKLPIPLPLTLVELSAIGCDKLQLEGLNDQAILYIR